MKRKIKHTDESFAISGTFAGQLQRHGDREKWFLSGPAFTAAGVVQCYSQEDYSRLDLVHAGRWHMRAFRRGMTARGLAIAAGRFSREIAGQSIAKGGRGKG